MPEYTEPTTALLPVMGFDGGNKHRRVIIAHTRVLNDRYTEEVLSAKSWHFDGRGYVATSVQNLSGGKRSKRLHQFVYEAYYGQGAEGFEVDHKNKCKLDNIPDNLRMVSHGPNMANRGIRHDNKSGYIGVQWREAAGKWYAAVQNRHLGAFLDKDEAARGVNAEYRRVYPDIDIPNPTAEGVRVTPVDTQMWLSSSRVYEPSPGNLSGYNYVARFAMRGKQWWRVDVRAEGWKRATKLFPYTEGGKLEAAMFVNALWASRFPGSPLPNPEVGMGDSVALD